ncbi:hypothetical protein BGW38_009614, partial [Lunasporangiospora selenospora]
MATLTIREDLNDMRAHSDADFSDSEDDETSAAHDPDTAEIASMERKALKYRKSLTMLSGANVNLAQGSSSINGQGALSINGQQPTREHLLAAKKSIEDLTAW